MNKKSLIWLVTPVNLVEEKQKFFGSKKYNPVFKYEWQENPVEPRSLKSKAALFSAIQAQDLPKITSEGRKYFDLNFNLQKRKKAQKILENKIPTKSKNLDKLIDCFKRDLRKFNLSYKIKLSDTDAFTVRPQYSKKRILINKNLHLEFGSVEGLVKHELVHLIRYENTLFNKIRFKNKFLLADEGLASYVQDYKSSDGFASLYKHAAEYLASQIASQSSFRMIYDFLRQSGFSQDHAWQRAARHKFGIIDTSKPGSFLRPAIYFDNELKVKKLKQSEIIKLFSGKISLDYLSKLKNYRGRCDEQKIKNYFLGT